MGNCLECVQSCKKPPAPNLESTSGVTLDSTRSITNISVPSDKETIQSVSNSSIETASNSRFSWTRLQSIYSELEQNADELQPLVLVVMNEIFCIIDNNIGAMSRRFYTCLIEIDKTFPVYFEECSGKNVVGHAGDKVLVDKITNHTVLMLHMHKTIINLLQNGNTDEAYDILKLVAISHTTMKVVPSYFSFMDMVMGKFLLSNGFLYDDNVQAIVIYFNFITAYIFKQISLQETYSMQIQEGPADQWSAVARENYRQMKRWHLLVLSLHETVNHVDHTDSAVDIPQKLSLTSQTTIPTEILKENACFIKYFVKKKSTK